MEGFKWFVGVDWSTATGHQVTVVQHTGEVAGEHRFEHSGDGLAALHSWLSTTTGGAPPQTVAVSIERSDGAVIDTLMERGFAVFSINPKQLDRFRDRFYPAGTKDDRRDAFVLAQSMRTDGQRFRCLQPDDPEIVELREWSRMAHELQSIRVALGNRIREHLRRYYPQILDLSPDICAPWVLEIWKIAPTPAKAAKVRKSSIERILKKHRIRRIDVTAVREKLRSTPLQVAPGVTEAASTHIRSLIAHVELVNDQMKECRRELGRRLAVLEGEDEAQGQVEEQRDAKILRSLPGVGQTVLATLLTEASRPLRERDYHALRTLAGVAPITRQSGRRRAVSMRRACNTRLRNALYHWARVATQLDPRSRHRYAALRARGKSHGHATRVVADRLLGVACAMLRTNTLFCPPNCSPATAAGAQNP